MMRLLINGVGSERRRMLARCASSIDLGCSRISGARIVMINPRDDQRAIPIAEVAYVLMACIVMSHILMADIVMAHIVMAIPIVEVLWI